MRDCNHYSDEKSAYNNAIKAGFCSEGEINSNDVFFRFFHEKILNFDRLDQNCIQKC
jgi:hypothetical protein